MAATLLAAPLAGPSLAQEERKVTVQFQQTPLRDAISKLFFASGLQYSIAADVPNVPITLSARDVSVPQGLRLLVRQADTLAPGLTSTKANDVYIIRMRSAEDRLMQTRQDRLVREVRLRYADACTVALALGGTSLPALDPPAGRLAPGTLERVDGVILVGNRGTNTLTLTGAESDVNRVLQLIRQLDTRPAQLDLRVSAGGLAGEVVGQAGEWLRIQQSTSKGVLTLACLAAAGRPGHLNVQLDGEVRVGGSTRSLKTSLELKAGEARRIAIIGTGPQAVSIWMRLKVRSVGTDGPD